MRIGAVEYLVGAAGVGLVVAAVANRNPIDVVREAISGTPGSVRPLHVPGLGAASGPAVARTTDAGGEWPADPANLVKIGQGGHRLEPRAAQAFKVWQSSFGQAIPITDSYRSTADQARNYARNPERFGAPGKSAHNEGRAVDVNLQALGITGLGSSPATWLLHPIYARLFQTAERAGWCNYQVKNGTSGDKIAEPWHFSYGVCK